jgi:hypothetical protein
MNLYQANQDSALVLEVRNRLQDLKSELHALSSSGRVDNEARAALDAAIRSIQTMSEDLAAASARQPGEQEQKSREDEARSEVDSGEFDMHG